MKRTPIISIRWMPDNFDSDWDGVPNYRDCEPFNPRKQDKDNISYVRSLLLKVVKYKDKNALAEFRKFAKTIPKKERQRISIDPKVAELLFILDRKVLPEMEPNHVSFGPFTKKSLKYYKNIV